jgi:undecaprenyl-diphosphatase
VDRERQDLLAGFTAAVAALFLFTWLATQVFRQSAIAFDAGIRGGLHAWASPGLTWFFRGFTNFGSELFLVPLGAVVVWRLAAAGRRHAAVLFVLAIVGGEALDYTLKLLFRRTRPEVYFGLTAPSTYSFPSGHAMLSACFYGVLAALIAPKLPSRGKRPRSGSELRCWRC